MKSPWSGPANRIAIGLLLIGYLMSQLVFLESDPDISMATGSRAAWTDDGILLCQVRNFLNGHGFDLMESDGFIKAPLFSIVQGFSMAVFGCEQLVARSTVLILVLMALLLLWALKSSRTLAIVFILTTFSLISVHQHAHLALSEMAAVSFVLLSGFCLNRFFQDSKFGWFLGSQFAIIMAVGMKIQFLYLFMLPPLLWWFKMIMNRRNADGVNLSGQSKVVAGSVIGTMLLLFAYYFVFRDEWHVFQKAQSGSLSLDSISWNAFIDNCKAYLFRKKMSFFVVLFVVSLGIFFKVLFDRSRRVALSTWSIFSFAWLVLELHKLPMDYLPMRYMVSFYVSMGLFSSAVLTDAWLAGLFPKARTFSLGLVALVFVVNLYVLVKAFNERTYVLKSIQERIAVDLHKADIVVGPWAPALTWGNSCRSFPVWSGFSGSGQIMKNGSPTIIISEKGGLDSGFDWTGFFGRDLDAAADSVTYGNIADWRVGVYWVGH